MPEELIINGEGCLLGRLASHASKRALEGNRVVILNAEKVIISGNKSYFFNKFREGRNRGEPFNGPFIPRMPDRIVKRTIRGMLPYKKSRGSSAFKRVRVFIGTPDEYSKRKVKDVADIKFENANLLKYLSVGDLSKWLGAKW